MLKVKWLCAINFSHLPVMVEFSDAIGWYLNVCIHPTKKTYWDFKTRTDDKDDMWLCQHKNCELDAIGNKAMLWASTISAFCTFWCNKLVEMFWLLAVSCFTWMCRLQMFDDCNVYQCIYHRCESNLREKKIQFRKEK